LHSVDASSQTRPRSLALLRALRARQWVKNVLVLAAPGAAGVLLHAHVLVRVATAFVVFCLVSSATYLLNDVHDREEDRRHPVKRRRPVAAGELPARAAVGAGAALALAGLALAVLVAGWLLAVAAGYLLLNALYTMFWRRQPYLDVACIAASFALRAIAGGVAAPVHLSRAFLLVVCAGALLLVVGKRIAELRRDVGERARASLRGYTSLRLLLLAGVALSVMVVGYGLWAAGRPEGGDVPWNELSAVPFAAWLARYGVLVGQGHGEAPEELVLGDRLLLACSALWLLLFAIGVHVAHMRP
jgi:decaprenyl-phosphate phosphoribosyltransferase